MTSQDIRETFLGYFKRKGHKVLPSSPVVPQRDPTLLFTNAGMVQFKDVFTGRAKPAHRRATTVQKCIRAGGKHNDLDNVGYTARHLTFFEMLGNFSFGDYFKKEAIEFGWDLLTNGFGLKPADLWVTVYKDDDEARDIWRNHVGVSEGRVVGLGEKDNYWSMGDVGPCGPCSEIHIDRGTKYRCGPQCGIGRCECDRFFELWNLVFMQFEQHEDGTKTPLRRPCIDTGLGVERMAMVLQEVDSVFETDILRGVISRIEELTGVPYSQGEASIPHRVIADHSRCLVFAFADGAEPSNEGRGYVMRRILRRAARYGRKLRSSEEPLLCQLVDTVLEVMGDSYSEIRSRKQYIEGVMRGEEEHFGRTLDRGLQQFDELVAGLREKGVEVLPGSEVFKLYDTFGFPADLVEQMALEIGMKVDLEGYESHMAQQKKRSRQVAQGSSHSRKDDGGLQVDAFPETHFLGYEKNSCGAEILAASPLDSRTVRLILSETPFYAESGGQVGDTGILRGAEFTFQVEDTVKERGRWIHLGRVIEGDATKLRSGQEVEASIDALRRNSIERNHTATHLLHAALRQVLGDHVHQKGSLVEAARLRFDVTHFAGITTSQRGRVEELVQEEIARNAPVETFETDYKDAIRQGAMALFGEKYGDRVRVVRIADFSIELCGGTHVERSGDIGTFALFSEGSVSAGVRRLEAMTEREALRYHQHNAQLLEDLAARLRVPTTQVLERVLKMQEEITRLRSREGREKAKRAGTLDPTQLGVEHEAFDQADGVDLYYGVLDQGGRSRALQVYDQLKARAERGVFLLLSRDGDRLAVLVAVSPKLAKAGWSAPAIFEAGKASIDARGGGRPEMVQGGGSQPAGAEASLQAMVEFVRRQVGS